MSSAQRLFCFGSAGVVSKKDGHGLRNILWPEWLACREVSQAGPWKCREIAKVLHDTGRDPIFIL